MMSYKFNYMGNIIELMNGEGIDDFMRRITYLLPVDMAQKVRALAE